MPNCRRKFVQGICFGHLAVSWQREFVSGGGFVVRGFIVGHST